MQKARVRRPKRNTRPLPDPRSARGGFYDSAAPRLLRGYISEPADRRGLKVASLWALVAHFVLFFVVIPSRAAEPIPVENAIAAVVLKRWEPPAPPSRPKKTTKRPVNPVPVPDPTPRDPEPIFDQEMSEMDLGDPDAEFSVGLPNAPPGPPSARGRAVGMGSGGLSSPVIIRKIVPEYPPEATRRGIQGTVYIEAVITEDGRVVEPRLIHGLPDDELNARAMEAILDWTFKPGLKDGEPVAVVATFTMDFTIH